MPNYKNDRIPETLKRKARRYIGAASKEEVGSGGGGLTSAQITALDGMFKSAAYTEDASTAYSAFKVAFGISDSGGGESSGGEASYSAPITMPTKFQKIEEIAKQFAVPTLNLYTDGRVLAATQTPDGNGWYLNDSVHLGDNGNIAVERIMGKWIAYEL